MTGIPRPAGRGLDEKEDRAVGAGRFRAVRGATEGLCPLETHGL